jgi:AraC-like DNA-binding protein
MSKEEIADLGAVAGSAVHSDGNMSPSGVGPNGYSKPLPPEIQVPWRLTLSACQVRRRAAPERHTRPREACDGYAGACLGPPALDCRKLAEIFAFFHDDPPLTDAEGIPGATGEVVWIRLDEDTEGASIAARPALVVYAANRAVSTDRMEIVPDVAAGDPLLQHIALVLQAEFQAKTAGAHLYAELLADALAVHFLRRYAAASHGSCQSTGGLPPYKLRRVLSYIDEHLEQDLSLSRLGGIAQTSVAHFARLFRQATGSTPHHYVLLCRIEHAKRLLIKTDLSLSEVAQRVGFADQSHLTALFRTHAATTPKAYRVSTRQ